MSAPPPKGPRAKYVVRAGKLGSEGVALLCWIGAYERVYQRGVTIGRLGTVRRVHSSHMREQVRSLMSLGMVARGADKRVTLTERGWREVGGSEA